MGCSQLELGWLAGIIDGEGSITIEKRIRNLNGRGREFSEVK
jgi:hypothetical protein